MYKINFIYLPCSKCCQIYSMVGVTYWPPQCWPVHLRWLTFFCYARAPELSPICINAYINIGDNNINSQKINTFWKMITNKTSSRLDGLEEDRRILPYNDHIAFPRHFLCSHIDQFYNLKYDEKIKRHRIHFSNLIRLWGIRYEIYKPIFELVVACTVCAKIYEWSMNIK